MTIYSIKRIWCLIFGHQYIEDPGIEIDGVREPLYYKGWVPIL